MTTPTPTDTTSSEIQSLQSNLNSLQSNVRLAHVRDEVEDIETHTNTLVQRVRDIRAHGYIFDCQLENRAADMRQRWDAIRVQVLGQINQQNTLLDMDLRSVETLVQAASARTSSPITAQPLIAQARSAVSSLESKVNSAEIALRGSYNTYQQELTDLQTRLKEVEWMLAQLDEAVFKLLPTESGVMAVEAVWVKDGKEDGGDPKGILYLTDQRILFEQKQEIATKKVLFITTEKKKVQNLIIEIPLALLETVQATKQGLFGHEDHLEMTFASGAPFYSVHVHIDGQDSNRWQGLLGQAKSRAFDSDRVVPLNPADVDRVKSAPARCPSCGGAVNQPVLRGMDSLKCEYCGFVIRL